MQQGAQRVFKEGSVSWWHATWGLRRSNISSGGEDGIWSLYLIRGAEEKASLSWVWGGHDTVGGTVRSTIGKEISLGIGREALTA